MKEYWSLEKQKIHKAVGQKALDAVFDIIPHYMDKLNHMLYFLVTQVNKFVFGF